MLYQLIYNSYYYYKEYQEISTLIIYDNEYQLQWIFTHLPDKERAYYHKITKN